MVLRGAEPASLEDFGRRRDSDAEVCLLRRWRVMAPRIRLAAGAACGGALLAWLTTAARADGRYPPAQHILFDPGEARHFVATTTFGLLESRDGGHSFEWRCESALGVAGDQDEMVAITGAGTTAAALTNGLVTTADGCSFRSAPELAGKYVAD